VMSVAMAVAGGGSVGEWSSPKCRKVIYVDGEMSVGDIQAMAGQLQSTIKGLKKTKVGGNLHFLSAGFDSEEPTLKNLDSSSAYYFYKDKVEEFQADLIVFDNIRTLTDMEDENSARSWSLVNHTLKKLRDLCTVVVVHHDKKTIGFSGSNNALTVLNKQIALSVPKFQEPMYDCGASFTVKFLKSRESRNDTMDEVTIGLSPTAGWKVRSMRRETRLSNSHELLCLVESGEFSTQEELAEELGVSRVTVNKRFKVVKCETGIDLSLKLKKVKKKRLEMQNINFLDESISGEDILKGWS